MQQMSTCQLAIKMRLPLCLASMHCFVLYAAGDLPVKEIFDKEGAEIFRVCIELPNEASH